MKLTFESLRSKNRVLITRRETSARTARLAAQDSESTIQWLELNFEISAHKRKKNMSVHRMSNANQTVERYVDSSQPVKLVSSGQRQVERVVMLTGLLVSMKTLRLVSQLLFIVFWLPASQATSLHVKQSSPLIFKSRLKTYLFNVMRFLIF